MTSLIQGSREWLDHRASKNNASEAGAIMGCNPWFPRNPTELFDLKTGAKSVEVNAAMNRGNELEPLARAALEQITGIQFTPVVKEKGRYSASMDGLDFDERIGCEIKVPQSLKSKLFEATDPAAIKKAAPHYWWQMVHQHYVTGCESIWFFAWHPEHFVATQIPGDLLAADRDELIAAWEAFGKQLDTGERPEPPIAEREDAEWLQAVLDYNIAQDSAAMADSTLKRTRQRLLDLADGRPTKGGGVSVIKVSRAGNVDYSKIPELKGVDLDRYRKLPTIYWSVK